MTTSPTEKIISSGGKSTPPTPKIERPKPEPKPLTPEYHKARKQLMLWASILLVWELVGVDLSKAEAMGGTLGTVIASLKSPQAIPWALVILVAYFLFKVFVEWHQCSETRKVILFAKFDYYSSWATALAAFALYFGQQISRVQLADRIEPPSPHGILVLSIGALLALSGVSHLMVSKSRKQRLRKLDIFTLVIGLALSGSWLLIQRLSASPWVIWPPLIVGMLWAVGDTISSLLLFAERGRAAKGQSSI